MKTFLLDLIPKIRQYSKKLDDTSVITGKHWVLLGGENTKTVYIFRSTNNQLIISKNGRIEKASWEHIGNESLVIDINNESFLFKHGFIDDTILALKVDGTKEYALFINEIQFEKFLDSVDKALSFLNENYLVSKPRRISTSLPPSIKAQIKKTALENQSASPESIPKKIVWDKNEKLKYTFSSSYPESQFKVYNQEGNWGYIDKEDNVVIDFLYEDAFPFSEGLAVVQYKGKKGFIDRNGDVIINFQFYSASYFKNGKSMVSIDGEEFFINQKGQRIN